MSWRELVNWNPESHTQFTQNTQNVGSKPKNTNSACSANSACRELNQKDSISHPEAQSNSAHITNSANSIPDQNLPTLEDPLISLREEEKALIDLLLEWGDTCQPGDEWQIPLNCLSDSDELRKAAEKVARERNQQFRIWRTGKDKLICKVWIGPESPPYRKPRSKRKFSSNIDRIQTMWSEEHGWCRWDPIKQDYVADPSLNP